MPGANIALFTVFATAGARPPLVLGSSEPPAVLAFLKANAVPWGSGEILPLGLSRENQDGGSDLF